MRMGMGGGRERTAHQRAVSLTRTCWCTGLCAPWVMPGRPLVCSSRPPLPGCSSRRQDRVRCSRRLRLSRFGHSRQIHVLESRGRARVFANPGVTGTASRVVYMLRGGVVSLLGATICTAAQTVVRPAPHLFGAFVFPRSCHSRVTSHSCTNIEGKARNSDGSFRALSWAILKIGLTPREGGRRRPDLSTT